MSTLVTPTIKYQESFLQGAEEFLDEERLDSTYSACLGYNIDSLRQQFVQFVHDLRALSDSRRLQKGWYLDHVLWLVDGDEYIGQTSIRPELCTAHLITYGGHIGYSIRPTKRRCGYGKKILALTLENSQALGLDRVLVTCDSDNVGSRKIIEYNGGRFESAIGMTRSTFRTEGRKNGGAMEKLRYWIDLASPE
jgi:predicted acetyltransferase